MYDESIHMPFIVHYPNMIKKGRRTDLLINNTDFAPTILKLAGGDVPDYMQGLSFDKEVKGEPIGKWRKGTYYRYWMHMIHHDIPAHFGIRTKEYKLIFYYGRHYDPALYGTKSMVWLKVSNLVEPTPAAWEFYDLKNDPDETVNRYGDAKYASVIADLKAELKRMRHDLDETDEKYPEIQKVIDEHWND